MDEILKVSEACALLQCSRSTLYNLIKTGQIKAIYVNNNTTKRKHHRFKMSAIQEYLEKNKSSITI